MDQTTQRPDRNDRPTHTGDFFVLATENDCWLVSTEMARHIEATLCADHASEWVTFVDLTGARVRLRSRLISHLGQSTAEQRALRRAISRAQRNEAKGDCDWREDN